MTEQNPYRAPQASVAPIPLNPPRRWIVGVVLLVVLQIVLFCLYTPITLDLVRYGDISAITFLFAALGVVAMALAGMLLLAKSRVSAYLFGISGLFFALVLLQWRTDLIVTGLAIALVSGFASARITRSQANS